MTAKQQAVLNRISAIAWWIVNTEFSDSQIAEHWGHSRSYINAIRRSLEVRGERVYRRARKTSKPVLITVADLKGAKS